MPQLHEQNFNQKLAKTLRETTAVWRQQANGQEMVSPENARGKRRCDILIDEHRKTMRPVIIECAYGGDNDKDAVVRLKQSEFKDIDTVIALAIPQTFREMSDTQCLAELRKRDCKLQYAALQRQDENEIENFFRFPAKGYCQGNVADLAAFVRMSAALACNN